MTHRTVGTRAFDVILAAAAAYSLLMLVDSLRRGKPRMPNVGVVASDLTFVAALALASGVAFTELGAVFLALPIGAALLLTPRGIALVSGADRNRVRRDGIRYPATHAQPAGVTVAGAMYVVWIGIAAVVLSTLLAHRRRRILELAHSRGVLVAQAVDAEERAQKRVSDALHDNALQNLLTARQELAEARAGDLTALERAGRTGVRLAVDQLRDTVRDPPPLPP